MFSLKLKLRVGAIHARRNFAIVAALFAVCFLFNTSSVYAATFVVNTTIDANDVNTADGICEATAGLGDCTLRAAITQANVLAGPDIITLPAGTYTRILAGTDNTNAAGDFDIISDITINGAGSGTTFIEAAATPDTSVERVLHFVTAGTSTVNGVTIRNGKTASGTFGAGVRVEGPVNVTLNSVVIRDNIALGRGGGIYVVTSTSVLTMNNSTVTNNQGSTNNAATTSVGAGGVYQLAGTTTINTSAIDGNTAIVVNSTAATPPSVFGGGVFAAGGTMNINSSSVNNNTATSSQSTSVGGGIMISGTATTFNMTDSTVNNNTASVTAGTGGAITGAIEVQGGTLTLIRSTVSGNTSGDSGAMRVATFGATAVTANINQSAIVNNTGASGAGGIFNVAIAGGNATTNLNNSTVGGNSTNFDGGGILNFTQGAGNAAVNINYSTVAANTADADANATGNGGGLANFGQVAAGTGTGTITLQSSIVADNRNLGGTSADIANIITSAGYNHVENTTGGTFTTMVGDVTGTDPGLTPLALNGGTTLNYRPSPTSPVLDTIPTGVNGCGIAPFDVDQRNIARPTDSNNDMIAACEKGAVEALAVTAAGVSIKGQVLNGTGEKAQGIANAAITMVDGFGNTRVTRTNSFGYYQFDDVEVGQTYVFYVSAKRYQFGTQAVSVNNEVTDYNFTPVE